MRIKRTQQNAKMDDKNQNIARTERSPHDGFINRLTKSNPQERAKLTKNNDGRVFFFFLKNLCMKYNHNMWINVYKKRWYPNGWKYELPWHRKKIEKGPFPAITNGCVCLWYRKIVAAQIREQLYYLLWCHWLVPEEQKGCQKGTNYLLCIIQRTFLDEKTKRKSGDITWINYKKPMTWSSKME